MFITLENYPNTWFSGKIRNISHKFPQNAGVFIKINLHFIFFVNLDNPYYFYNDPKSPQTPESQTSTKGFSSIFKRRNSKGQSPRVSLPEQARFITSANLDATASVTLGSPRSNLSPLTPFSPVSNLLITIILNYKI